MIVKKFKKGRGDEPGVVQVRLMNLAGGGVVINVVDAAGNRVMRGSIASLSSDGLRKRAAFSAEFGFKIDKQGKINVT